MRRQIHNIYHKILVFLHLSPLSLAEKCRLAFGAAVLFILALALAIPYVWMEQLTIKALLDAGKAKAEMLQNRHFQFTAPSERSFVTLDTTGQALKDVNNPSVIWIRFNQQQESKLNLLSDELREIVEYLRSSDERVDRIKLTRENGVLESNYVKVFRANDSCLSCHNPQGAANAFNSNEPIGAVVIKRQAAEISKAVLLNKVWIVVAGLLAGAGAIVAFYVITQRVILRPIRQLRGLANNVADGNLDIRSSIKTRDEYEKLADAFNHMLDNLHATEKKRREANRQLDAKIAELSERNIELFKANKLKGEFLANISHEFRTPLNAILGFAEILKEKPQLAKKDKGRKYAENIITSGRRLLNMINDLLDLAKTEAGKIQLHIEKTSLSELCKNVVASFASLTKRKKIKVKVVVDDNVPDLTTDAGKVQQILYNFLSNSVKFTPERGKIEVRAGMKDDKTVRIAVSDTGCGIPENDKKQIFQKFRQLDGSITRGSAGSGLGLAICRELAVMLSGELGMESAVDRGSTFWVDLPVVLKVEQKKTVEQFKEPNP